MLQVLTRRRPPADLAIDFGTARTTVVEPGSGVAFDEPSLCCFRGGDAVPAFIAAGVEAERWVGRVSRPLKIVEPLRHGVVSDMDAAREMLRFAMARVRPRRLPARMRALIGVPADATLAEKRALITAAQDAGISDPVLIPEPLAAAAGIGLDISAPRGRMIVDCGAGVVEAAVISLDGICASGSVRGGGAGLTRALIDHFRTRRRFRIGFSTAEQLKLEISGLLRDGRADETVRVRGLAVSSGLPRHVEVPAAELIAVWERDLAQLVVMVRQVLRSTPPELAHDIFEDGILLTGGAAETAWLADRLAARTGVACRIAERPRRAVARGLAQRLGMPPDIDVAA